MMLRFQMGKGFYAATRDNSGTKQRLSRIIVSWYTWIDMFDFKANGRHRAQTGPSPSRVHVPGGNLMILQKDKQFNVLPSHKGLRKYIQYYNVVFPEKDTFLPQYTIMPNACGTLSLAFDGFYIRAELWGATTMPIPLGAEPNGYRMLLLIQFSPYGLYQITGQSQTEFADKRLSLDRKSVV